MRLGIFLLALAFVAEARADDFAKAIPENCRQLVFVTTADWESPRGTLRRYERERRGRKWVAGGDARAALLGEHGLAWGRGLLTTPPAAGPRKREGDRRAPAGIFALLSAFGKTPAAQLAITRFPYTPIVADTEAVDDPASRFYNRIVRRSEVAGPDWKSSERMARIPDYELGVVIAHNPQNTPGAGSCIFLHEWRGERVGTAGCTVLRAEPLLELVRWLDAGKHPVLVQLPQGEIPAGFP